MRLMNATRGHRHSGRPGAHEARRALLVPGRGAPPADQNARALLMSHVARRPFPRSPRGRHVRRRTADEPRRCAADDGRHRAHPAHRLRDARRVPGSSSPTSSSRWSRTRAGRPVDVVNPDVLGEESIPPLGPQGFLTMSTPLAAPARAPRARSISAHRRRRVGILHRAESHAVPRPRIKTIAT